MRAAILALLLVAGVARADQSGARSHFLSGLELYSQGKYAAALAEYRAAWVIWEDPELLLDMAECNRHLGNLDEAREQYRGFLQRAPGSPLRGSVERQLARLDHPAEAPPPVELVAAPARGAASDAPAASHAGRVAKAIGIAGWATSIVALGVGIYTWREYTFLEAKSHAELETLRAPGAFGGSVEEQAFFMNPGCTPPSTLMNSAVYRADCNRGRQYADATSAMFATSTALAVAGTISYIIGAHQAKRARAVEVRPALSLSEASLTLRFPF
jgi:tetratricopeptide (TPR) repeat protein